MTVRVIGAGMGRTGTYSLKNALEILGVTKCYHMVELIRNPAGVRYWEGLARQEEIDWEGLFAGYQGIVDFPGCCFYQEIFQHYPDAKVILTVRDPEDWYASTMATIFQAAPSALEKLKMAWQIPFSPALRQRIRIFRLVDQLVWDGDFQGDFLNKDQAIAVYQRHIEQVKQTIPADQLLVYQVTEGWSPLCAFLELPLPSEPFPNLNQRARFNEFKAQVMRGE
jgi:Sulfotransferase domain